MKLPAVGVGILVPNEPGGEHLLIGKRGPESKRGVGLWSVPGGAVDPGETIRGTAQRELEEEAGLFMPTEGAHVVAVTHTFYEGESWVTFYVTHPEIRGEPENKEPGKCEGWEFIRFGYLKDLPLLPAFLHLVQRPNWFVDCLWHSKDLLP